MRAIVLLLLSAAPAPVALAEPSAKPWAVPGLTLTEPQTRTKPGYARVTAKAADKARIKWKVRAQFEDSDVEFEHEVRDDGRSVQVTIPDSRGVIEVTAVAVVDGEPTEFAETIISVDYKPRPPKADRPAPQEPPKGDAPKDAPKLKEPEKPKGKVKYVFFVQAQPDEPDPDVKALINSVRLKNELKRLGVTPELVIADSENFRRRGLADPVRRAGGAPCVVYVTEDWLVRKYTKLSAATKADDVVKEAGQ